MRSPGVQGGKERSMYVYYAGIESMNLLGWLVSLVG
jgi:hypothetical protein